MSERAAGYRDGSTQRRVTGRNELARQAHLRSGAGPLGGSQKQKIRRKRKQDHVEERNAERRMGDEE
jgi:hypothetical protein